MNMLDTSKPLMLRSGVKYEFLKYIPTNHEFYRMLGIYLQKDGHWDFIWHNEEGIFRTDGTESLDDLIYYNPASELKVDDKIIVFREGITKCKRHFKCLRDGMVITFGNGRTSFTSTHSYDEEEEWDRWEYPQDV